MPLQAIHPEGFFEAVFTDEANTFPYRLRAEGSAGHTWEFDDPYRFPPVLTDYDLHLLGEGTHYRNWEKLGAHIVELEGVAGVVFAVWAPTARRVSVVGDFNAWDGRRHPMRARGGSGIWELFVPGLAEGDVYKYEIKSRDSGRILLKADPFAFFSELRPKTASIVHDIDRPTWIGARYEWRDQEWMSERPRRQAGDSKVAAGAEGEDSFEVPFDKAKYAIQLRLNVHERHRHHCSRLCAAARVI